MYRQVKFKITDPYIGDPEILGGIAQIDDDNNIVSVICGCCGGVFEPADVKILRIYDNWVDLCDSIIGGDDIDEMP